MSLSVADKVFLAAGLIDFGMGFVCIGAALHIAYTKMDVMLDHLKNSPSAMALTSLKHGGAWGKLLMVGGISGLVTFPDFYVKRGSLSAEDLDGFPVLLKRKLVILQWCSIGVLVLMVILAIVVKLDLV